mmetsp:Transcript_130343/g.193948  ORF Transcript_130343/g.193948 Transcript_130343/m.193948 type:complete len:605 (+) Transcript_130343:250-2064(+)
MNGSQRPCRLTMRPPNEDAKDLFFAIKNTILEDRSNCQKYGCFGGWAGTGFILFIVVLVLGATAGGAFALLIAMLGFGVLFHFSFQEDAPSFKTDENGHSKPRQLASEKLETRIRTAMETCKSCIEGLEYAPQVNCTSSLNYFVDTIFPSYGNLNVAGCIPKNAAATYAIAWTVLADYYHANSTNHYVAPSNPRFDKIKDLHDKWINLIVKSSEAARKVTAGMDSQRLKARKQAMSQGVGVVTDFAGIYNSVEIIKSLYDIKGSMNDIREVLKDSKGVKTDNLEPRTGLHDITSRRITWLSIMITVIFAPFIAIFAALEVPAGAWGMVGFWVLMLVCIWWISTRYGNSFNALEDLYDVELYFRQCIKYETEKNPPPGQEHLIMATNMLRDLFMDAYYDTLGIHLQTELLTFGTLPPTGEPTPLFWTNRTRLMMITAGSGNTSGHNRPPTAQQRPQQITSSTATNAPAIDEEGCPDDHNHASLSNDPTTGPAMIFSSTEDVDIEVGMEVQEEGCPDDPHPTPQSRPENQNGRSSLLSQSGRQSSVGLMKPESSSAFLSASRGAPAPMDDIDDDMPSNPRFAPSGRAAAPAQPTSNDYGGMEYGSA